MHHKEHHGRKAEMEHHKERAKHKAAHHSKMAGMHSKHPAMHEHGKSHHGGMIDNKHVNDSHQQGIERVKMRHGELEVGQHGKMGMGHHSSASFKRNQGGGGLTPRKA